jgi:hypothetical protein
MILVNPKLNHEDGSSMYHRNVSTTHIRAMQRLRKESTSTMNCCETTKSGILFAE